MAFVWPDYHPVLYSQCPPGQEDDSHGEGGQAQQQEEGEGARGGGGRWGGGGGGGGAGGSLCDHPLLLPKLVLGGQPGVDI